MKHLRIAYRVHLLTVVALAGLLGLVCYEVHGRSVQLEADRLGMLHVVVDTALATSAHFHAEETAGRMSRAAAQKAAAEAIRVLRYRGQEYVWINDLTPRMVMHPFRPDLEGKDVGGVKDPTGQAIFVAFADIVRAKGEGTLRYFWPRPGAQAEQPPVEKLSVIAGFAPWSWVVGTGVYVDDLRAAQRDTLWRGLLVALVAAAILGLAAWRIGRGVIHPLVDATAATREMAGGDLASDIPGADRRDEFGTLAIALQALRADGLEKRRMESESQVERAMRLRRQAAMDRHTQDFGTSISGVMTALGASADAMRGVAIDMVEAARRTAEGTSATSEGAGRAAQNLTTIASATEQLTASSGEISRQVARAAQAAHAAVDRTDATNQSVNGLSEAVARIGEVVRLIAGIAAQTNLLALNATIEAARAGEAGKGFAVVASEVKLLATQTAQATEQISAQVGAIQSATASAVDAIQEVGAAIAQVSEVATAVAAAVEEQGAATREIAHGVQSVSQVVEVTTHDMTDVAKAARSAGSASDDVQAVAADIARVCGLLNDEVGQFLVSMRAEDGSRRLYERVAGNARRATLRLRDAAPVGVELKDISRGGAAFCGELRAVPGTEITIVLDGADAVILARIVRSIDGVVGVAFRQDPGTLAAVDAILTTLAEPEQRLCA